VSLYILNDRVAVFRAGDERSEYQQLDITLHVIYRST
jgi:hypothetical protein